MLIFSRIYMFIRYRAYKVSGHPKSSESKYYIADYLCFNKSRRKSDENRKEFEKTPKRSIKRFLYKLEE